MKSWDEIEHLRQQLTVTENPDLDAECKLCAPFPCDNPDQHFNDIPSRYTPLKNRGCVCGADFDGRDCMCFEGDG